MRQFMFLSTLVAVLLLTACGGAQPATSPGYPEMSAMATAAPAAPAPSDYSEDAALEGSDGAARASDKVGQPQAQQPGGNRLVIRNAYLSIEVESVSAAETAIRNRAEQLGGYVVSVQTSGSDENQRSSMVFRVPAAQFETALSGIEGLANKVFSRNLSGDDVTEEFVDLESRLRNLEATRDRLLELLARATRVEDALQVSNALTDVQGQIEQIRGRMQYLTTSAAFATISVDLAPVPPPPSIVREDSWQPMVVARRALADLVQFGQGILELGIVFLIWAPVWLPVLLFAYWVYRRLTRSQRSPTASAGTKQS
jgi:hypothetical protein